MKMKEVLCIRRRQKKSCHRHFPLFIIMNVTLICFFSGGKYAVTEMFEYLLYGLYINQRCFKVLL